MNVVVNGRFLTRRVTGVERYGSEILQRLPHFVQGTDRLRVIRPAVDPGYLGQGWEQVTLPAQIGKHELLWSPANTGPLRVRSQAVTIHDLSPLEHPEWFVPAFALWYRVLLPALVRHVRKVITPSEYVRRKVRAQFGLCAEEVSTVPGGVDSAVFRPGLQKPAELPDRYILFVGSLQLRKNLSGMLQVWESLQAKYPGISLLIAGIGGKVFQRSDSAVLAKRVIFTGYYPEAQLPLLYANATVFVMPSFDEGFGLPVLEAMACGTPVLAARAGALPEVAGEAACYFDPTQPASLADALVNCLEDHTLRKWMREKGLARVQGYSWQTAAERLWRVLQECG